MRSDKRARKVLKTAKIAAKRPKRAMGWLRMAWETGCRG